MNKRVPADSKAGRQLTSRINKIEHLVAKYPNAFKESERTAWNRRVEEKKAAKKLKKARLA